MFSAPENEGLHSWHVQIDWKLTFSCRFEVKSAVLLPAVLVSQWGNSTGGGEVLQGSLCTKYDLPSPHVMCRTKKNVKGAKSAVSLWETAVLEGINRR